MSHKNKVLVSERFPAARRTGIGRFLMFIWLLAPSPAFSGIENGNFEGETTEPWQMLNWSDVVCDEPQRIYESLVPNHFVCLGDDPITSSKQGCSISAVRQWFNCSDGSAFCTVYFWYKFEQNDVNELALARVQQNTNPLLPESTTIWLAPVDSWTPVPISVIGCSESAMVEFMILDPSQGPVESILRVDDANDECTANDNTNPEQLYEETYPDLSNEEEKPLGEGIGIPTVSAWGLAVLTLILMAAGSIEIVRRRVSQV